MAIPKHKAELAPRAVKLAVKLTTCCNYLYIKNIYIKNNNNNNNNRRLIGRRRGCLGCFKGWVAFQPLRLLWKIFCDTLEDQRIKHWHHQDPYLAKPTLKLAPPSTTLTTKSTKPNHQSLATIKNQSTTIN